ncbi:MAG: GNAT family protein [Ginsengibacter sp.]
MTLNFFKTAIMFPEIFTERFLLRKILPSDQQKIFEALSHEAVIKYYGVSYETFAETSKQMEWYEDLLKNATGIWWAIANRNADEFLGACGFNNISTEHKKTEMGYWLLPPYWKMGIMKEVLPHIIFYAFDILKLHRIEASVETGNTASKKLLINIGFKHEGTVKECEWKNEKLIDLEYYGLVGS